MTATCSLKGSRPVAWHFIPAKVSNNPVRKASMVGSGGVEKIRPSASLKLSRENNENVTNWKLETENQKIITNKKCKN